jgi:hypothetical protein
MKIYIKKFQDGSKEIEVDGMDEIGHQICMGIRKGLFGVNAGDYEDISNALTNAAELIADSMSTIYEGEKE